ncbi:MAG: FtsQ-type POTRA domain-containing protein [Candidatus Margulisbacteria bacterium]|nr:FtsQ-type POTRA domain-containing protein [Candidatus Margulisiibacteriota bacterium]
MARRERREKKPRPKNRKFRLFIAFLSLVFCLIVGAYILSLPIWQIKDIVVNGAKILSEKEIRAIAGIPLSENLFYTSFSRAKANLRKITAIKAFHFYRIPPATVLISITERRPVAAIIFPGKSVVIDEDGFIINRNTSLTLNIPNMADLPVISGIAEKEILKAERIDPRVSRIVSDIIFKLTPYLEAKRLQLKLGGLRNITLLLDDLLLVKIGGEEEIKRKMEVFMGLLPVVSGKWEKVDYIDVRFPDNPVIRYK